MPRLAVTIALLLTLTLSTTPAVARQAGPAPDSQAESAADPVQVIQGHVDAYNRRDVDALVAPFAADAELFILPGTVPVYSGREAIRDAYADQLERNCLGTMGRECPDLNTRVTSWQGVGRFVVTYQLVTLVDTAPPLFYVLIYEVREGLIHSAWFLVDA